jgi:hypothetical protein
MARKTVKKKRPVVKRGRKGSLSDRAVGLALRRFRRRATDLVLDYVATGRLTPKLKRTVLQLRTDVDSWNARTGHKDIRATESQKKAHMGLTSDDDSWICRNCQVIMVSRGRLCFLVGCDPAWNQCSYVCLELPRNHRV